MRKFAPYFPAMLMDFSLMTLLVNSSFLTIRIGMSASELGFLAATSTAIFVCLAIPLGRLSDRIGRLTLMIPACFVISAISIALPLCRTRSQLWLIYPLIGSSQALFWPAYEAWLAEREGDGTLIQRLRLFNLFWSPGSILGPVIASYFEQIGNPILPFRLVTITGMINFSLIFFQSRSETKKIKHYNISEKVDYDSELTHTLLSISRIGNFASWFCLGFLRSIAPKLTKEQMGIAPKIFGNLIFAMGFAQMLMFFFYGTRRSKRWQFRILPIIGFQTLAVIGFASIGLIQNTNLWLICFGLIGVSTATTYFGSMFYGLIDQEHKGDQSGWHESVLGLGALLGPLLGGQIADLTQNPQSPFLMCGGVIFAAILIEISIWRKRMKNEE